MNAWEAALAYVVGPLIVTAGTVLAAWWAAKGSIRAAKVSSKAGEKATAVDGYHELVQDLQSEVRRIRDDHDALRRDHEVLNVHVKRLEDQAKQRNTLIRHLIMYIRVLRDEILALGGSVPPAPDDLADRISTSTEF